MKNSFRSVVSIFILKNKKWKKRRFFIVFLSWFCLMTLLFSCKGKDPVDENKTVSDFAKGADVSWVTEMENAGIKFYNSAGQQTECMALLKSLGMNTIRLRTWVNPENYWNSTADLLSKAQRAKELGMRIMIDFHYSDTWADPSKQTKPKDWKNLNFDELKTTLIVYTTSVLIVLRDNGITPEWVQIGNETNNGMLWEDGKASTNMAQYAALTLSGYNTVKSIFPNAKVVVHLSNGYDNNLYCWLFDGLKNNGAKWDVIGLSVYPSWFTISNDWASCNNQCLANMNDLVTRYGSEVMVVECGMSWDSPQVCKNFLNDLITKVKSVKNNKGKGVIYWEPECYKNWNGYSLGAFDNNGKPTIALDAFK